MGLIFVYNSKYIVDVVSNYILSLNICNVNNNFKLKGYKIMKANQEIRAAAKEKGVKMWEIADVYGVNDGNFSRKLRYELPEIEKTKILAIIDEIAERRNVS